MIYDLCKIVKLKESSDSIGDNVENDVNGEEFNDVLNDTGESSSSGSGTSKRYTETFKVEVGKFLLKHSTHEARKKYGISVNTAQRWKKIYNASENDVDGEDDVLNATGESSSSGSGHSKRYTETFKAEVCNFMLKHSAQEAIKKYGISWNTAKRWKKANIASGSSCIVNEIIDDVI